ncbi:MAG: toll/interleukin-1 receptor domain-containing protein, partial [Candidatus Tectomicrobia bacterium]
MKLFISYRRDDSDYVTDAIVKALSSRFGLDNVFKDTDNIPLGQDYREVIRDALSQCDALIAVIHSEWLTETDHSGCRRIDSPDDWVRFEIEEGLKRNIRVVPVLLGHAEMPRPEEFPSSIRELAFRNATKLRFGRDFQMDLDDLIRGLEPEHTDSNRKSWGLGLFGVIVFLSLAALLGSLLYGFPIDLTRWTTEPATIGPSENDAVTSGKTAR